MKKGQISAFVIVSVIIFIVAGFVLFLRDKQITDNTVNPEIRPIYNHVQSCVDEMSEQALTIIGENGGYIESPKNSFDEEVAYYFIEGENLQPNLELIEKEIESYLDLAIYFCTSLFEDFSDFNITQKEVESNVKILDEKVQIDVQYPLSIKKGENLYNFENFQTIKTLKLGNIHKAIGEFIPTLFENSGALCVSCLYDLSEKYGLKVNVLNTDDPSINLIAISDDKAVILDTPYTFYFVIKLKLEGLV